MSTKTISKSIPCRYSVVKFIEDEERDEPVNIGLILQSRKDNKIFTKFIDYDKLRYRFDNPQLLKILIENVTEEILKKQNEKALQQISKKYADRIRVTEYRGTLAQSIDKQLDSLFSRFVSIEQQMERIKKITLPYIRKNIWDYAHDRWAVKRNFLIKGSKSRFRYDFLFENENKVFHSISYDALDSLKKTKLFDWNVMDALSRNGWSKKNFGAIISEPSEDNPKYDKMNEQYEEGLGILESKHYDLIHFDESGSWKGQIREFN